MFGVRHEGGGENLLILYKLVDIYVHFAKIVYLQINFYFIEENVVNVYFCKYRVRQRGCSLTHSARTPPAVHQGITIWVDDIEFEKK